MPRDTVPAKRKATEPPAPLFDNNTRGFLSTRTTATTAITASNVTSRRYATHSQIIATLPKPLFGDYEEALYARPNDLEDSAMDVDDPASNIEVLQSGLPGITIKQKVRKRYLNSVRLSFCIIRHHSLTLCVLSTGCTARHMGSLS